MSGFPDDLPGQMEHLLGRISDIERRNRNRKRTGKISEVDFAIGMARVEFHERDGKKYVGGWMPWKEVASGDIKTHIAPTIGEQVEVLSESGDLTDGIIDMSVPSTSNPRPHDGPEAVITKGSVRITIGDDTLDLKAPTVNVVADAVNLGGEGGKKVARIGDKVSVTFGSSKGLHKIVEGSAVVKAT